MRRDQILQLRLDDGSLWVGSSGGLMLLEVDPDILDGLLSLESAGLYRVERLVKDYAGFDRLLILARAN